MNFLKRCCLANYGRVPFLNNMCCKDVFKHSQLVNTDERNRILKYDTIYLRLSVKNNCYQYRIQTPMLLTLQVRFRSEDDDPCIPRLHRDLQHPNFDAYRKDEYKDVRRTSWGSGDGKPGFSYVVHFFGLLCATYAAKSEVYHFASYMAAAADVLALATIEVDVSKIAPGACASFKWRGKPLFIKHRTEQDIELENKTPVESLRDPETEAQRTIKPQWLVVIGVCTHLGCVPIPNSGDWAGGFYCPCHGSHYDNIGRARKGPAPLNLEVPPHKFISDELVLVG